MRSDAWAVALSAHNPEVVGSNPAPATNFSFVRPRVGLFYWRLVYSLDWETVVLRDRLTDLLEPVVKALGYEVVLLEFSPRDGAGLLRLFIDGPDGIGLDDCEKVSREIAAVLDVEDVIRQAYQLEISSPGFDRPLVTPAHFERFKGKIARIQMLAPIAGRRRFQGALVGATETDVTIETPDGVVTVPLADIEKARLVPNFDKKPREKTGS